MSDKEQALEVLRTARDVVLCDESAWTQGEMARDAFADPTDVNNSRAVQWCRRGAMYRACSVAAIKPIAPLAIAASAMNRVCNGAMVAVNDDPDTTYSSTIDDFDTAIKWLEDQ